MTVDEAQNRMIFKTIISRGSNEDYVTYSWGQPNSLLTVTLDWNREEFSEIQSKTLIKSDKSLTV
ncbi:hypothetical protein EGR_11228 [Echinococcus granulosus]|uniref:Uncharacterized protein n=1 Tax=Echinococcus granulosus TaxID=6210 RepID=W6TYQ6_ECHGR|nr:hypothetical protein EGR_11228 [Echinococcus granulosus]EUB53915.1 hypothetical protein EGR_11228 [Echinococcus granulosus]